MIGVEESKSGKVEKVIVKFDNPKAGKNSRRNHPTYARKYPDGTVITKMEREYTLAKSTSSVGGSTARLIQHPLILAFSVTGMLLVIMNLFAATFSFQYIKFKARPLKKR